MLDALVEPNDIIKGHVPIAALPALLHESSHHTCLVGSVGFTLCFLDRQARRQLSEGDRDSAVKSIMKIAITLEAYRPVLEGVALFTEFDVLAGDSKIMSRPLWWALDLHVAGKLIGRGELDLDSAWEKELAYALMESRATLESTSRRLRVLSTSLRDPGAYVLGYLFVKTWWRWVGREHSVFADADFTAFFLGEYFFNDFELAGMLLDADATPRQILEHTFSRLRGMFVESDWQTVGTHFEEVMYAYDPETAELDGLELGPSPFPNSPDAEHARDALARAIADAPIDDQKVLARRTMLHLASLPLDVATICGTTFGVRAGRIVTWGPTQNPDAGNGRGSLDLFLETATKTSCTALSVNGRIAHLSCRGKEQGFVDRWARQLSIPRNADTSSSLDQLMSEDEIFMGRYRGWVASLRAHVLDVVAPGALASVRSKEAKRRLILEPAGFRSLLGRRSTKALAVLSMAERAGAFLEEIDVTDEEFDLAAEAEELNERLAAAELPPIVLHEDADEAGNRRHRVRSWI
ncbi:MAG: hypothetical protein ACJ762_11410 [Solirubrobacteraceae bacterium]